ncbi:Phosphoglycerate mutase [Alkaliphilus metalliredigens QYMF]|uniref:Phosphoglycerate mutase n=1 Tax=Alkaliphilus metalliredigens (strain QYMF) TaxID=293826 RepID=A6TRG4_ALKMQ|nr:histidine phosphatase family protein [Alkaliphilus metalliredigens]ABR48782.1 Phosphoglycerate mutase [Alkaliphilus metalliredigens QYMF]
MKQLFLLRHGETNWNLEGRTQGRRDSRLTPGGLQQAELAGQKLMNNKIQVIYSSNLNRAKSTAMIIKEQLGIPCHYDHGLSEMNFGEWEGLTIKEIESNYVDDFSCWRDTPHLTLIPKGENLKNAQKRIVEAIENIMIQSKKDRLVLVSHGAVIKLYLLHVLGMPLSNFYRLKQNNCAINLIEYKECGPVLVKYNDLSHLDILSVGDEHE